MLESRSVADDDRIDQLESQVKNAKYVAEEADRKYDEVNARLQHVISLFCDPHQLQHNVLGLKKMFSKSTYCSVRQSQFVPAFVLRKCTQKNLVLCKIHASDCFPYLYVFGTSKSDCTCVIVIKFFKLKAFVGHG